MQVIDLVKYRHVLELDGKKFKSEMTKAGKEADNLQQHIEKVGSNIRSSLTKAFSTVALIAFGKKAIDLASDLEEVQNVVDVTFGDGANVINKWALAAGDAFGMTELQAKQFNGTMGSMLKSMRLSDDVIMDMSTSLVGLAGDFASFYDSDVGEAFNKIRSGISGETEPLKQWGINMSVANLEAYALSQGLSTVYSNMTQAQQATLRYNYLLDVSRDAQGDFARNIDSFANQQRILSLEAQTLASNFGEKLLPQLSALMPVAQNFVKSLDLTPIATSLGWILSNSKPIASGAAAIGAGMLTWNISSQVLALVTAIKGWTTATKTAEVAQKSLNLTMASNPIGAVITVLASLTAALYAYKLMSDDGTNASKELYEQSQELAESYRDAKKSIDDSTAADLGKVDASKRLTDELYNLNEQLANNELSTDDATQAKTRMHNIADELRRLMPDVRLEFDKETGTLITQRGEVDLLSESYRKLALSKAYAAKMDEVYAKVAQANMDKQTAEEEKAKAKYNMDYYDTGGWGSYAMLPAFNQDAKHWKQAKQDYDTYNNIIKTSDANIEVFNKDIEKLNQLIEEQGITVADTTSNVNSLADAFTNSASTAKSSAKSTAKTEKDLTRDLAKSRDKQFSDLRFNLNMNYITEKQYYNRLADLRDMYFDEGTDEYQKYTLEIYDFQKKTMENVKKDINDTFEEITKSMKTETDEVARLKGNLENKLKGYSPLFSSQTVTIKNWDNGNSLQFEKNSLTDFKQTLGKYSEYATLLNKVKERGISKAIFNEIMNLSIDDGIKFMELLLGATDDEFNSYGSSHNAVQAVAKSFSDYAYQDETQAIADKFNTNLISALSDFTQNYENLGVDYATALGDGFLTALNEMPQLGFDMANMKMSSEGYKSFVPANSIVNNSVNNTNNTSTGGDTIINIDNIELPDVTNPTEFCVGLKNIALLGSQRM